MNFYRSLPYQAKAHINLIKAALRGRYHRKDRLYNMRVKLHELLKQVLFIRHPLTYDDAVTFAKGKPNFADSDSDTLLMDLLQEIHKEVDDEQL